MRDGPTQRGRACFTMGSRATIAETLILAVWLVAWLVYKHLPAGLSRLGVGILQLRWALGLVPSHIAVAEVETKATEVGTWTLLLLMLLVAVEIVFRLLDRLQAQQQDS